MAGFVADVASLSVFWTVPRQVPHFVAVEAGLIGHAVHRTPFGAAPRNMPRLIAVVARRSVRTLVTVLGEVALAIAPIATLSVLLAITSEVAQPVAFVAFLAAPAVAITTAVPTTAPSSTTRLRTFTGEMSWTTALVANT